MKLNLFPKGMGFFVYFGFSTDTLLACTEPWRRQAPDASRLTVKKVRVGEISKKQKEVKELSNVPRINCIVISIFCNLMYIITKRLGD
jgi:hypothetical protein